MKWCLIFVFTFLILFKMTDSIAGSISGIVSDQSNGNALAGVTVVVANQHFVSASDGTFRARIDHGGKHDLTAKKPGYKTYSKTITLSNNEVRHNIELEHDFGFQF
jgi:uncharacterized membrane protein